MKNVLITGATGFVGKHLIKRLLAQGGYNVVALVRESSNLDIISDYIDDIQIHYYRESYSSVESLFKSVSFDCVFHLAALSKYFYQAEEVSSMISSNITFGTFILEAMKQYGCPYFINTSTYWQHYEDHNYQPICLYAATKKAFEDIVESYCVNDKIKAISLKLYDVYGYDDHRGKLLNILIKQQDQDKVFDLTEGEQKLYMVFIDDVINAYLVAEKLIKDTKQDHAIYNVYGNAKHSLKEIVGVLEENMNKKFNINWGAKEYYQSQIMDPYVGSKLDGWDAKTPLEEGIKIILKKEIV